MYDTAREDAGPTGTATLAKLQDPPALRVILPPATRQGSQNQAPWVHINSFE